jgi:hypothetical protein
MRRVVLLAAVLGLLDVAVPALAEAQVVAHISLSTQRMNVSVDGVPLYSWPVSTARPGYRTPTGTFRPTALFRYDARVSLAPVMTIASVGARLPTLDYKHGPVAVMLDLMNPVTALRRVVGQAWKLWRNKAKSRNAGHTCYLAGPAPIASQPSSDGALREMHALPASRCPWRLA